MTDVIKVVKREAVFIPVKDISRKTRDQIIESLQFRFYEEKACGECDNRPDRHNDLCDQCAAFKGGYDLGSVVKVKDNSYLKIPVGSSAKTLEKLERSSGKQVKVMDKSPRVKIKKIKFLGTFKPGQEKAMLDFIAEKRGVLKAPPRSGKCVDGSTELITNRGHTRIDSLFEGLELSELQETIYPLDGSLEVLTSDGMREVKHLYTKVVDRTILIKTENGKTLRGTVNHPVMVSTDQGDVWRPMANLKIGDLVVVTNQTDGYGGLVKDTQRESVVEVIGINEPIRVYDIEVPSNKQFFGNGILCHNTVVGTATVCELGVKTLILASQRDWLMGFHETFVGSKTQKPLTDLDKSRIKLCKTLKDFQEHDVCLATVQTFYSDGGEKILAAIRDMFQFVICDEVHTAAADKYIRILARLNVDYGLGLSGTPDRKDQRHPLVSNVLGPIAHEMIVKGERPEVRTTKTKYSKQYKGQVPWASMVSSLENDKGRLKLIAETALKDMENGHMLLIPMAGVKPIAKLVKLINDKAGKRVAYPFTGSLKKKDRDEYIQKARDYKIKILVGTAKILSTGINIPRASCLYELVMSSNLPNATQRMRRILTPMEGKPRPLMRFFLDDMNVRRNCMRTEYFGVLLPDIKPIMSDATRDTFKNYFSTRANSNRFEL